MIFSGGKKYRSKPFNEAFAMPRPIVDKILAAKQKDPNTNTSALEKQIDEMGRAGQGRAGTEALPLHGFTPEEIAIITDVPPSLAQKHNKIIKLSIICPNCGH